MPPKRTSMPPKLLRAQIAAESHRRIPDLSRVDDLRREHAVARIEEFARGVLGKAPPLTRAQREHLAALLLEDGAAGATA